MISQTLWEAGLIAERWLNVGPEECDVFPGAYITDGINVATLNQTEQIVAWDFMRKVMQQPIVVFGSGEEKVLAFYFASLLAESEGL